MYLKIVQYKSINVQYFNNLFDILNSQETRDKKNRSNNQIWDKRTEIATNFF